MARDLLSVAAMADRTLFCVDSYGATATQWLAACFNAHPCVAAAHSFFWPPAVPRFGTQDAAEEEVWRRPSMTDIGEFFAHMRSAFPDKACLGTIHAFPIHTALAYRGDEPMRAGYLLRHPVLQIESIAAHWRHRGALDPDFQQRTIDGFCRNGTTSFMAQVADLASAVDAAGMTRDPHEVLLLVAMVDVLESHRRPFLDYSVPIFTMERMTREPAYLTALLRYFTGDLAGAEAASEAAFAAQAMNRHRARQSAAADVFTAWPRWARRLFSDSFVRLFADRYTALGYDLEDAEAAQRSTLGAVGQSTLVPRRPARPLRPIEISTIPRSGTWYLKYFFQFLLARLRGEAPVAIREIYRRVKSTAVLDLAAEPPTHDVFSFAAPLGFSPLVINHLACAGFWELSSPLRTAWAALADDLGALEFQQSLRPTLDRLSPTRNADACVCFVYRHPLDLLVAHARMFADQVASIGAMVRIPFNPHWPLHLDFLAELRGDPFEFYVRHMRETRLIDAYALQMLSFVAMQSAMPDRVLILRYEDIQADPRTMLGRLLGHCGVDVQNDDALAAAFDDALASTRKDAMKGYERELGHSLSGPTYFFGEAKQNHITRAPQRDWRRVFSAEEIAWARARFAQLGIAAEWFDGLRAEATSLAPANA